MIRAVRSNSPVFRTVTDMADQTNDVVINPNGSEVRDQIPAIITDCTKGAVFAIDGVTKDGGNVKLSHAYSKSNALNNAKDSGRFSAGSLVVPLDTVVYYIAPGAPDTAHEAEPALLLLLVLTIIGASAMQITRMEERMAGNARDSNLALQGAEATLRDGESVLQAFTVTDSSCAAKGCLVYQSGVLPSLADQTKGWWAEYGKEYGVATTEELTRKAGAISRKNPCESSKRSKSFAIAYWKSRRSIATITRSPRSAPDFTKIPAQGHLRGALGPAGQHRRRCRNAEFQNAPLYLLSRADPNVLLNMSVETPMGGAAYTDNVGVPTSCNGRVNDVVVGQDNKGKNITAGNFGACYFPSTEYLGYFDPAKCYEYSDGQFNPAALSNTTHACSGRWSGNFLNWASMTAIDMFIWTMTGGNRVSDTADQTVIQRARKTDNDDWFPYKVLSSGYNVAPSTVTPLSVSRIFIYNTTSGFRIDDSYSDLAAGKGNSYNVKVRVCDASIKLESNCVPYTPSSKTYYKPHHHVLGPQTLHSAGGRLWRAIERGHQH